LILHRLAAGQLLSSCRQTIDILINSRVLVVVDNGCFPHAQCNRPGLW